MRSSVHHIQRGCHCLRGLVGTANVSTKWMAHQTAQHATCCESQLTAVCSAQQPAEPATIGPAVYGADSDAVRETLGTAVVGTSRIAIRPTQCSTVGDAIDAAQ